MSNAPVVADGYLLTLAADYHAARAATEAAEQHATKLLSTASRLASWARPCRHAVQRGRHTFWSVYLAHRGIPIANKVYESALAWEMTLRQRIIQTPAVSLVGVGAKVQLAEGGEEGLDLSMIESALSNAKRAAA